MSHKKLEKSEVKILFDSRDKIQCKKRGRFLSRKAVIGETILTIVAGKLETLKKVEVSSVVLRNIEINSSAETYVIDQEVFEKRYETQNEYHTVDSILWQIALAKGEVEAFEYVGETITFIAPWNEEMICETGDYIARPIGGKIDDIYRIEKETFLQTYYKI